jgi:cytochrome c-type biogenesis protein CcsB
MDGICATSFEIMYFCGMVQKVGGGILKIIFSVKLMAVGLFVFAFAIGFATFLEDSYDTNTARLLVYNATWFELVLVFLTLNLIMNIWRYKLFRKEKWSVFLFHVAFIVIMIGAALTRYIGFEGSMPIEEGKFSDIMYSSEPYFQVQVHENQQGNYSVQKYFSDVKWANSLDVQVKAPNSGKRIRFEYVDYKAKTKRDILPGNGKGKHILHFVIPSSEGPQDVYVEEGGVSYFGETPIAYNSAYQLGGIDIKKEDGILFIKTPIDWEQRIMRGNKNDLQNLSVDTILTQTGEKILTNTAIPRIANEWYSLESRSLTQVGGLSVTFKTDYTDSKIGYVNTDNDEDNGLLTVKVSAGKKSEIVDIEYPKNTIPTMKRLLVDGVPVSLAYGPKPIQLPFKIGCKDFRMVKYAGSQTISSYESDLVIQDDENKVKKEIRIFMNNVYDYGGYRVFQSSYMAGGRGTILSVNYDWWGTNVTYLGYLLMAFGFVWSLFTPKSRFQAVVKKLKKVSKKRYGTLGLLSLILLLGSCSKKEEDLGSLKVIPIEFAEKFSKVQIQDYDGRVKPFHTHAQDILNSIYGKSKYKGLTAQQLMLSVIFNDPAVLDLAFFKTRNEQVNELIGISKEEKYACYKDFMDTSLVLKAELSEAINAALRKSDKYKNEYDKSLIKLNQSIQHFEFMFTGSLVRIYPVNDLDGGAWVDISANEYSEFGLYQGEKAGEISKFYLGMKAAISKAYATSNFASASKVVDDIIAYQKKNGGELLLSDTHVKVEIAYNKLNIFFKLLMYYTMAGVLLLLAAFVPVIWPEANKNKGLRWTIKSLYWITLGLFGLHFIGLVLRWYIAGHAPWSNGYEALVFISFVTMLAGVIFSRRNKLILAGASILTVLILGLAHASHINPQITNLQPVLKSVWLVIHVMIITGSYGFLGLGAILGLISLVLYCFKNAENKSRIQLLIDELTYTAELTMTIGLYMAAIGTFLGGVWANESWGRYWGWDPKETWALVIVLIYAIILHLRLIPKANGKILFHALSILFGFGSVVMTFVGVNYFLSKGLHSYARGEEQAIPLYVYMIVITILGLVFFAWYNNKRVKEKDVSLLDD